MRQIVREIAVCLGKDFKFYFQSKMIFIILPVYAALSAGITFYASDFLSHTTVNMQQFFRFQPQLMSVLIPALTMRLWADEYRNNTLEILLSQPISFFSVVCGKFLACWLVVGLMLLSSFGVWLIAASLVPLENGWILLNYFITFLMTGSLCAVSLFAAVWVYNGLGAFLLSLVCCHLLVSLNFDQPVAYLLPNNVMMTDLLRCFDFKMLFNDMIMGQINFSSIFYFGLLIVAGVGLTTYAVDFKRR